MSKPELSKMMTSANLIAAIVAAIETASAAGLSKDDVKAALEYVSGLLDD
jgi:hypothetical protein